jgi:hypothetical protein
LEKLRRPLWRIAFRKVYCVSGELPSAAGVVVLGPYRSGTSVTAQVLAALGVDFGPKRHFIPATHNNPAGFFERGDINRANELLLESAGQSMAYPGDPIELAKNSDRHAFEAADLSWRKTGHCWGVKDPRMCATLYTWIEARQIRRDGLRIIHVRRDLDGAVRSAMAFASVRKFCDGTEQGVRRMLARYAELAQWQVDTLGVPTLAFDYERLLGEPAAVVEQIAGFLDVTKPARIRGAAQVVGKGKGMVALQLERYLVRAPRRLFYLLTGRNIDGSRRVHNPH